MKLLNVNDHPRNSNKKVFFFKDQLLADHFEQLMLEQNIDFEKQIDEEGDRCIYFGIRKSDYKAVQNLNFLTHGKFRKPFIQDPFFKYLLLAVTIGSICLAIIGAILSS